MNVPTLTVAEARDQLTHARCVLATAQDHLTRTPSGCRTVNDTPEQAWLDADHAASDADACVTAAEHRLDAVRSQQRDYTLGDYEPERHGLR